jgi:riboflavin synthase
MFTGIIEDVGRIERLVGGPNGGKELTVRTALDPSTLKIGDSIAVSGVCLTATRIEGPRFWVDAGPETLARTTIGALSAGSAVNLERALTLASRLGGHLVQGHVDGLGTLDAVSNRENATDLRILAPKELLPLIAPRGAITVDGVSLTVTGVEGATFTVSIIPHTQDVTTLSRLQPGARVNLEADLFARYVARILEATASARSSLSEEFLREHGF